MRKTLSGKNMLKEDFLKEHPYRWSQIFSWLKTNYSPAEKHHGCEYFGGMVLHRAPWCSSLALRLIWWCLVGCWGWVPAGGRHTGKQGPHPEEKVLSSSTVGLGDWARQLPGGR